MDPRVATVALIPRTWVGVEQTAVASSLSVASKGNALATCISDNSHSRDKLTSRSSADTVICYSGV